MRHEIIAKNTTVTAGIRSYTEKKFEKFEKYGSDDMLVHTKIEVKDGGRRHKVEVTIRFGKEVLRAEQNDENMYVAIDNVEKTMTRLLKRRKEKLTQKRHAPSNLVVAETPIVENEYDITRVKRHEMQVMDVQEACEAMEMVGHPFYVYRDKDEDRVCAVYLREDGAYGQIIYD